MSVLCLNELEQASIVRGNTVRGINQTELSAYFKVSRRTIQRVLIDAGVLVHNISPPKPKPVETPKTVTPETLFGMASQQRLPIDDNPKSFISLTDMFRQNDKIVHAVRSRGFTEHTVDAALEKPTIKRSDVEVFLARLPDDELATILYTIGLVRVKQHDARATLLRTQKEAANG